MDIKTKIDEKATAISPQLKLMFQLGLENEIFVKSMLDLTAVEETVRHIERL